MERGLRAAKWLLLLSCLLTAVVALLLIPRPRFPATLRVKEVNNNPDKFHLVATNAAYDFSFTYDPLAADEWRFETGGFIVASQP